MYEASVQHAPDPGLPPVKPPSGRFIIQLFLVPGLIVGLVVVVLLFFQWIIGGPRSTAQFLKGLDDSNPEVRWRAAADLAQVLPRDNDMAVDVKFALDLTERLRRAIKDNNASEKVWSEQRKEHKGDPPPAPKALRAEREHIWYLISCLGNFQVPVTVPVLQEIAVDQTGWDEEAAFRKRTLAVNALTVMGDKLKAFDKLPPQARENVFDRLKAEGTSDGERGVWVNEARAFLEARKEGKPSPSLRVADTLAGMTGEDTPPFLRKQVAGALTLWDGPKVDDVLFRMVTTDTGKGKDPVQWDKEQQEFRSARPDEVERLNRLDIRYNAALSLARRGSPLSEKLFDLYREMLDFEKQKANWKSENPTHKGSEAARATEVLVFTLNALEPIRESVAKDEALRSAVEALGKDENKAIRSAAQELLSKMR